MNNFEKHYTRNIVPVTLEGVTFHVELPTVSNMRFQREVASHFISIDSDTGELKQLDASSITPSHMVRLQIEAMVNVCILRVEGWEEFTPDKLMAMPEACEELWTAITEIKTKKEAEAEAIAKKPLSTSDGRKSGQAKAASTNPLQVAEG